MMAPHTTGVARGSRTTTSTSLGLLLLLTSALIDPCRAHGPGPRTSHGFVGLGIPMYQPYCAFACRDVLAGCRLNCSSSSSLEDEHHHRPRALVRRHPGHVARFETSAECRASGDAFLESLAWCLNTRCEHESVADLDRFWHADAVGSGGAHQPRPKYGYAESLARIPKPPTKPISHDEVLEEGRLVPEEDWAHQYGKLKVTGENEVQNTRYG